MMLCCCCGRARAGGGGLFPLRMCDIYPSSHPKYLDDGDVQKRAAEAHGEGRGGHNGRTGQEAHRHGERRHLVPARDDPGLQRHEQPSTTPRPSDPVNMIHSFYCLISNRTKLKRRCM